MNRIFLLLVSQLVCAALLAQTPFGIKNRVTVKKTDTKILEYIRQKETNGVPLKEYERQFQTGSGN
ncbi:MAG: hypothetical protein HYZ51_02595, partial [Candidatus Doudnabacteria bacterium]|nr:hypothetical protein [Candidatus Doudnabacteria bacterium]